MAAGNIEQLAEAKDDASFLDSFTAVVNEYRELKEAHSPDAKAYLLKAYKVLALESVQQLFEVWLINIIRLLAPDPKYDPTKDAKSVYEERNPAQEDIKERALKTIASSVLDAELVSLIEAIRIHQSSDSLSSASSASPDLFTQLSPKSTSSSNRTGVGTAEDLLWNQQVLVWQQHLPEIVGETAIKNAIKLHLTLYASLFRCYRLRAIKRLVNDIIQQAMDEEPALSALGDPKELKEKIENKLIISAGDQAKDNHVWSVLKETLGSDLFSQLASHPKFSELFQQLKKIIKLSSTEKLLAVFSEKFVLTEHFKVTAKMATAVAHGNDLLSSRTAADLYKRASSTTMRVIDESKKIDWYKSFIRGIRDFFVTQVKMTPYERAKNALQASYFPSITALYTRLFQVKPELKHDLSTQFQNAMKDLLEKQLIKLIRYTRSNKSKSRSLTDEEQQTLKEFYESPEDIIRFINKLDADNKKHSSLNKSLDGTNQLVRKLIILRELINLYNGHLLKQAKITSEAAGIKTGGSNSTTVSPIEKHVKVDPDNDDEEIFFTINITTLATYSPRIFVALEHWQQNDFCPLITDSSIALGAPRAPQAMFGQTSSPASSKTTTPIRDHYPPRSADMIDRQPLALRK